LCLDSRLGDAQTYLTVDVPNWITSHLQVRPPDRGWAIAGLSHGGTCAIQLSTQAPRLYPFFVDISGQIEPTLGSRQLTISRAFGGDAAAFARADPIVVLAHTRFPHSAGVFVAGANDRVYLAYPDPAALGSIATAIGRAYLPNLTSRQALRLLSKLRWPRHQGCGAVQVTDRTAVRSA
jgi:S-formylglutathione hydrolase FrmB